MMLTAAQRPLPHDDANPSKSYVRVVIVEILVVSGLYLAGRYFG